MLTNVLLFLRHSVYFRWHWHDDDDNDNDDDNNSNSSEDIIVSIIRFTALSPMKLLIFGHFRLLNIFLKLPIDSISLIILD